ncbi:MAG: MaoC family dehydratase N-terminal domain-containing protein [Actinomycetota bacterium]|nr:MaoC family dehydratase N-terminal domain-containing protein [Actinomycetota bacterium]
MPLDQSLTQTLSGRTFPAIEPYEVCAEKIAEFARATGSEYDGRAAPATFPIVVAFAAMTAMMADPDAGIALHRVVHGEQRFQYTRPVVPGDRLTASLTVESVRVVGGAEIIGTRSEITAADGGHVCTAFATLMHRAES